MKPLDTVLEVLEVAEGPNRRGEFVCFCCGHDDRRTANLHVGEWPDGTVKLKCFAGCKQERVLAGLQERGVSRSALYPKHNGGKAHRTIVETYDYQDAEGSLLFQAVRFEPKTFRQRRPSEAARDGWAWNLNGVEPVLYRLPEVVEAAKTGGTVYVPEGEKDVERLRGLSLIATCNPMGAGKWRESYAESLRGARAVTLADADKPGHDHAEQIARSLQDKAASVKVLKLAGLPEGGDVSDWLDAGGTAEELTRLAEAAPEWTPEPVKQGDEPYKHDGSSSVPRTGKEREVGPVGRLLSEVEPEEIGWLWRGRLAKGKLTIAEGDPGEGKSTMTTDFAARVSVGRPWPDGAKCEEGGVVLCSAEDGEADTIRPRLDAAGGDASRVLTLAMVPDGDSERLLTIPDDLEIIRRGIERVGAVLVVIDPLSAFLSSKVNSHRDQDVRRALAPLAKLAEDTGTAILVVRHLNQASGGNPLYRGQGSIGIVGAARSALLVAKHPEDDRQRVLASLKSNLAEPAPSLAFALSGASNGAVRLEWKGETPYTAAALLSAPTDPEDRSALEEAREFLRDTLGSGPVWSGQVKKEARAAGISEATLRRAKSDLGVRSIKEGDGSWSWMLPEGARGVQTSKDEHLEHLPIDKGNSRDNKDVHVSTLPIQDAHPGTHNEPLRESRIEASNSRAREGQGAQDAHVLEDEHQEQCAHGYANGNGCYLCDFEHPYRTQEGR